MPTAPCREAASGAPSSWSPTPAMPAGGTALTSAATLSCGHGRDFGVAQDLNAGFRGVQHDVRLLKLLRLVFVHVPFDARQFGAEAVAATRRHAVGLVLLPAQDDHPRPGSGRQHGGRRTDGPGAAEHHDALACQIQSVRRPQPMLDRRHHPGRRREGAAGIGEDGHLERRHHRFPGDLEHVHRQLHLATAEEDPGAFDALGTAGKNRVLHQGGHVVQLNSVVGSHGRPAGVVGHVHVEWTDMFRGGENVQDVGSVRHVVPPSLRGSPPRSRTVPRTGKNGDHCAYSIVVDNQVSTALPLFPHVSRLFHRRTALSRPSCIVCSVTLGLRWPLARIVYEFGGCSQDPLDENMLRRSWPKTPCKSADTVRVSGWRDPCTDRGPAPNAAYFERQGVAAGEDRPVFPAETRG